MKLLLFHRTLLGLVLLTTGSALAIPETEPNNFELSADEIDLGFNGDTIPITGALGNSTGNGSNPPGKDNSDFSTVTNSAGYSTIGVSLQFGSSLGGGDSASLRITGPNVDQNISVSGGGQASFTINPAASGATYVVEIRTQFNDGQKSYTLTYDPSPDLGLLGQINLKKAEIERKKAEIAGIKSQVGGLQNAVSQGSSALAKAKQKQKQKKAKTNKKQKKAKKKAKKISAALNSNRLSLSSRNGALSTAEAQLQTLESELAALEAMLP